MRVNFANSRTSDVPSGQWGGRPNSETITGIPEQMAGMQLDFALLNICTICAQLHRLLQKVHSSWGLRMCHIGPTDNLKNLPSVPVN